MTSYNTRTIAAYDEHVQDFVNKTQEELTESLKSFIDDTLSLVSKEVRILEVGSGTGRDADYIESLGYSVYRTDASDEFIKLQRDRGRTIEKLNLVDFSLEDKFDLIYANAVLLHFTVEDFKKVLRSLEGTLKEGGYIALILKHGEGSGVEVGKLGERFFKYWQEGELRSVLNTLGFKIIKIEVVEDTWLNCIIQKQFHRYGF